jgi:hypothetical protein
VLAVGLASAPYVSGFQIFKNPSYKPFGVSALNCRFALLFLPQFRRLKAMPA